MFEGKIAGFIGEKMFKDNEKEVFKSINSSLKIQDMA